MGVIANKENICFWSFSTPKLYNKYYSQILKKHNTTQEEFTKSFKFYQLHPELLKEIYEDLLEEMNSPQ